MNPHHINEEQKKKKHFYTNNIFRQSHGGTYHFQCTIRMKMLFTKLTNIFCLVPIPLSLIPLAQFLYAFAIFSTFHWRHFNFINSKVFLFFFCCLKLNNNVLKNYSKNVDFLAAASKTSGNAWRISRITHHLKNNAIR